MQSLLSGILIFLELTIENGKLKIIREEVLLDKSFKFAIGVVKLYKYLCNDKKEFILSKQLLRYGTSIGANIHPVKYKGY